MVYGIAYSKKYNYLIMHSPKSGCTLIKGFFNKIHPNKDNRIHYIGYDKIESIPKHILSPLVPKIIVVRNPYYRVVSMFTNKYISDKRGPFIRQTFVRNKINVQPLSFIRFLKILLQLKNTNNLNKSDCHIASQLFKNHIDVNTKIVKLESLDIDLIEVYKTHICNPELLNLVDKYIQNQTTEKKFNVTKINTDIKTNITEHIFNTKTDDFPDYCYFYNTEAIDLVYTIYKNEFEKFGYSKDSYPKVPISKE
jgi:hypothetical protein